KFSCVTGTNFGIPVVPDVVKISAMESEARLTGLETNAAVSRTCRSATLEREPAVRDASINAKEHVRAMARTGESTQFGSTRASRPALASPSFISVSGRLELRGTLMA